VSLTVAEAWALASKVALIDARHCGPQESLAKREEALELMVRARTLDPDPCLLINAQAYLEQSVQPSAHYDRPMTASELKRVYTLRAAKSRQDAARAKLKALAEKCGPLPTSMLAIGAKPPRKPTKRTGTKPYSLAQRLAAACHTLKEP
jgi:hypothetical protein